MVTAVGKMESEILELRELGVSCGLSRRDLLDFVQKESEKMHTERLKEKKEKERVDRDERAHSLEMKRKEKDILDSQAKLEVKRGSVSSDDTSFSGHSSRLKAKASKLPSFDDTKDDVDAYLCIKSVVGTRRMGN